MAPHYRLVDRDAFARFAGIGIGCQQFQASQVLNIQVGPNYAANSLGTQHGREDSLELNLNVGEETVGDVDDNYGIDSDEAQ